MGGRVGLNFRINFKSVIMNIIQKVSFDGKNINDVFQLPCVKSVEKGENGRPYLSLFPHYTEGRLTVQIGDALVQYETGMWQVFGKAALERKDK